MPLESTLVSYSSGAMYAAVPDCHADDGRAVDIIDTVCPKSAMRALRWLSTNTLAYSSVRSQQIQSEMSD
jgi:hypothetical protein